MSSSTPSIEKTVLAEVQPEQKLIDLATDQFKVGASLSDSFTAFFTNVENGKQTELRKKDEPDDPARGAGWGTARTIPAEWIQWLCTDPAASKKVPPTGIQLACTEIEGELHLEKSRIPFWLTFYRCYFTKQIFLHGASIEALGLPGCYIQGLQAEGLTVEKDVNLSNQFHANGVVWLRRAKIGGTIQSDDGQFMHSTRTPDDPNVDVVHALNLSSAKIGAGLSLKRCTLFGAIATDGAQIEGNLDCEGAKLWGNPVDPELQNALYARSMKVTGDVRLCKGFNEKHEARMFEAKGAVLMAGATIGGKLDCTGGRFANGLNTALEAISINTGSDVILAWGFESTGEVNLNGATIGGTLDCTGGHFDATCALSVISAKFSGSVFLNGDFTAKGTLDFSAAFIDRSFELDSDAAPDKNSKLILQDAKAGALLNAEKSWPTQDQLDLHGFVFNVIDRKASPSAETELRWLHRQKTEGFSSQPYEQMAGVLRSMGLQDDAIDVLIVKNQRFGPDAVVKQWLRAGHYFWSIGSAAPLALEKRFEYSWKTVWCSWKTLWNLSWYYGFGPLIGYGYRPWRALIPSVLIIFIGWSLFRSGYRKGIIIPTDSNPWKAGDAVGRPFGSAFNAFIYSLEKFVPIVKLEMGDFWIPDANDRAGRLLLHFLHFYILAGWVLTTLWVAGLTGLLKT
jgi:hypothetical protein